ncbi:hypothetical protein LTR02_013002 [Friedmanniomyces endolithicus]|nr:hypothetical protein LTR38_009478 [Friedmanniomyces endolithicus]KAK0885174.1 hypothetical protein LTR87_001203 [Friedmanniomyces endolithicus]KAK0893124.1 hypothetical protein LTR02_013002 [Friedmanniomyces endolithicus]
MSFLRVARQHLSLRPITRTAPRATFTTSTTRTASDYGSGEDAPPGQKPSEQTGKNPSEHLEHPGPAPPSVAGGSQQSGQQKDDGKSQQQQPSGGDNSKGTQAAQPKIFQSSPPKEESEEVRKHNEEVDRRAEKTSTKGRDEDAEKDKVGKEFWSGTVAIRQGGVDKQP